MKTIWLKVEETRMAGRRSLKRSIVIACIAFITALSLLLSVFTFDEYRKALYDRYESYITDILNYVSANIDVDDMRHCLETGEKSEEFQELQALFDQVKDTHKIDFLYVVVPLHPGERDNMMNIMAAMSSYEKEFEPESAVELGGLTGDSNPAETAKKYYDAKNADGIVFFEEASEWGVAYTGIMPLHTSDGEFFAELCVDVPVQEIHDTIRNSMLVNVGLIVFLGILFTIGFVYWSSRNIVEPIDRLEKSVAGFVSRDHGQKLVMEAPDIHTNNELESLSVAVMKMADDINEYVVEVVDAERDAERMCVVASEMAMLANKDSLTGLHNKHAFTSLIEELQGRIDGGEDLAFGIAVLDCDNLKGINDQYGHARGDEYLQGASRVISHVFAQSPAFRIGGDEFAVVLMNEDFESRKSLAKDFYDESARISAKAQHEWEEIHVAIGIAVFDPNRDKQASDTVRRADKLMYDNKRGSKMLRGMERASSYFMEGEDVYWKEQYIIDNFKIALEERWIKVYYQPIMRIENGKLSSLEALARWFDPLRGMISPAEFIYVLSRTHQLHMLDFYMVEEVCREFGVRGKAGLPLVPVSVNISAQDFDHVDVPARLKEIVERHGLTPDNIIVEITEYDVAQSAEQLKEALRQIRANGFKLWMDDFGSGYSSLNVLSQYEFDRIKFDMDLVRHLDENNGTNRRILEAMVRVCDDIGVKTLAEGVETREQLSFLEEIGCELAQGFYFYGPDSMDSSIERYRRRSADIPVELYDGR